MKKIKNTYHKKMTFPVPGINIDAGETKEVEDSVADALAGNAWIQISGVTGKEKDSKIDVTKEDKKGKEDDEKPRRSKNFISDKDNK